MAHAQRSGQSCGRAWNCAYRDSFSICASLQPKLSQIYAELRRRKQDRTDYCMDIADVCRAGASPASLGNRSDCLTVNSTPGSRAAHVGTGAGVDLDGFAFFDEQRNVDSLARLKLCRFGDVAGGVTAKAFW